MSMFEKGDRVCVAGSINRLGKVTGVAVNIARQATYCIAFEDGSHGIAIPERDMSHAPAGIVAAFRSERVSLPAPFGPGTGGHAA